MDAKKKTAVELTVRVLPGSEKSLYALLRKLLCDKAAQR